MTRRAFQTLLGFTAAPARSLWAQDAKTILAKVSAAYQALQSYECEGKAVSETTIKAHTSRSETGFLVAFEAPNKFRLEFHYATAGDWLRVSDGKTLLESRSITKENTTTPVTPDTLRILNGSPLYNFRRLSETAEHAELKGSESIPLEGKQVDCYKIGFTSHRRELRQGETPGPSMVWVAKDSNLVLREEIRTLSSSGGEKSESKRTTSIEKMRINQPVPAEMFSTKAAKK